MAFSPQHDLGLVVLNTVNSDPMGTYLYSYVVNLLLSQRLRLNRGVPRKFLAAAASTLDLLRGLGDQARPGDTVRPSWALDLTLNGTLGDGQRRSRRAFWDTSP